jgi:hypothetical protein
MCKYLLINRITNTLFKIVSGCALMVSASAAMSQVTVQAESYTAMSGIQTENTSDVGGGLNVGWTDAGDWMSYSVNLPTTGKYKVSLRVASLSGGGSFRLEKAGGGTVYGTVNVMTTGGWQNWQTITQEMTLSAGQQAIGFAVINGGFNINWIRFEPVIISSSSLSSLSSLISSSVSSTPACAFSTLLQAEDYETMLGIQTEATSDVGGGLNVGWIDAGDSISYRPINIPYTGAYKVSYRVAAPGSNGVIRLEPGLVSWTYSTNVPATGGWQNWVTVSQDVTLAGGTQTFKIAVPSGGYNINWIRIEAAAGCSSSSVSITSSSASSSSDRNHYNAPRATTAPVIDGVADTVWDKAAWAPIDVFWLGSQRPGAQDFSGRYKAMWDAGNLYLLFDITDDVLLDATANPLERYWDDDSVEIFIDENKNGGNHQYNTSAWAYHVSTLGDNIDFTNSTSPQLLNSHITVRRISVGTKHVWEMRMRIYGENYNDNAANTPVSLFAGKLMGFSACYNDNDASSQRESMVGSVDTQGHKNDMGYKDASVFGTMQLIEAP